MDSKKNIKWFQDILNTPAIKIFHNAMYDVCWLRSAGIKIRGKIVDTMIAASLIDENRMSYALNTLAKHYVGIGKDEKVLQEAAKSYSVNPKSEMYKLPAMYVGEYAERDAEATLKLWQRLNVELHSQELMDVFNLETKLFPCLVDMKFKGVKIDVEKARAFGKRLGETKTNIINYIERRTGIKIEMWAASSIKALLDHQNIDDYKKTKAGLPQLPKDYLSSHKNKYLRLIAKARNFDKTQNTFIEGLLEFVHDGRIHADINQIRSYQGGTVTGRFSMSNPNLQQIPSRGFIGKKMRER